MVTSLLAALRALPAIAKAAEQIAEGVRELNRQNQERVAKERLDEKNKMVSDFINARNELRDPEVQRGDGPVDEPPTGGD